MLVLNNLIEFLKQEGVSAQLVEEVRHYSEEHTVDEALKKRIPVPHFHYYGNKVWEEALAVLLCGRNLLLAGEKATGKNVLAQNLAAVFERPAWEDRTEYAKTFAVSDLHGRFDLFAAILKTGEVINDKYEWIYWPITLRVTNAVNDDYSAGFKPDIEWNEYDLTQNPTDALLPLGDPDEFMLGKAISLITGINRSARSMNTLSQPIMRGESVYQSTERHATGGMLMVPEEKNN